LGQTNTHTTIVHRDIKSSNILIGKNEWNLYLADFGVALALPQVLTEKDFVQIGTIRYMAPELLEGVIAHTREALCSVDMYALALVMWEIITQCDVYPTTGKFQKRKVKINLFLCLVYRPPYEEYVTNISDESFFAAQLYDIVVIRKCRPTLIRELKEKEYASVCIRFLNISKEFLYFLCIDYI
jgi:serine/threonine protein kinase